MKKDENREFISLFDIKFIMNFSIVSGLLILSVYSLNIGFFPILSLSETISFFGYIALPVFFFFSFIYLAIDVFDGADVSKGKFHIDWILFFYVVFILSGVLISIPEHRLFWINIVVLFGFPVAASLIYLFCLKNSLKKIWPIALGLLIIGFLCLVFLLLSWENYQSCWRICWVAIFYYFAVVFPFQYQQQKRQTNSQHLVSLNTRAKSLGISLFFLIVVAISSGFVFSLFSAIGLANYKSDITLKKSYCDGIYKKYCAEGRGYSFCAYYHQAKSSQETCTLNNVTVKSQLGTHLFLSVDYWRDEDKKAISGNFDFVLPKEAVLLSSLHTNNETTTSYYKIFDIFRVKSSSRNLLRKADNDAQNNEESATGSSAE